jgi:hypothetical protein
MTGSPGTSRGREFIVPKIREFKAILKDRSRPVEERRFALRSLVHWIEDLHMPLHVGENRDRGGNDLQVRWFDRLHRAAYLRPGPRTAPRDARRSSPSTAARSGSATPRIDLNWPCVGRSRKSAAGLLCPEAFSEINPMPSEFE